MRNLFDQYNGKKDLINVLEGYSGINKQIESQ